MNTWTHAPCMSRQGKPLSAYPTETSAFEGAAYVQNRYGNKMKPYRCQKCSLWHLSPEVRSTPNHHCNGCSKLAYDSEEAAERRAEILSQEQGVSLRVYWCPYDEGWHLTSRV